ncbi:MaoC family dehydratase [Hydrogenophaga sp. YM1]|uniref:MaoC family dehydratase n=1 Tax=Hydrogenophaga sp. YM1 TaxID=2806262 RepID=UPI0019571515|nr:MaoC family dehydratase [Hydrogenophaga sp. YM1]QRR34000.1 MaoC family dehydratase [Hydrogenophaga sp. YM1]
MVTIERPGDLAQWIGKPFPAAEWFTVTQTLIDQFADLTGDHQWLHCDPERAARESPYGITIAHGLLTLSLMPRLRAALYEVRHTSSGVNYGADKLRFTAPVKCGARIRLQETVRELTPIAGGVRFLSDVHVEVEGEPKPALVIETIGLLFD